MRSLEGAVLPGIISITLSILYIRKIKDKQLIVGFLLFAWTIGISLEKWGITGLHIFTGSIILWPLLVFLLGDRFPWPLTYPLAFFSTLIPDLYGAGTASHWQTGWFFGVGGAGFQDGLFLIPLKTVLASAVLSLLQKWLRRQGLFASPSVRDGL